MLYNISIHISQIQDFREIIYNVSLFLKMYYNPYINTNVYTLKKCFLNHSYFERMYCYQFTYIKKEKKKYIKMKKYINI